MKVKTLIQIAILALLIRQNTVFGFQENHFKISEDISFSLSENEFLENYIDLKDEPFLAVSLGSNCWPAGHLNNHLLRKRAFPFDWVVSSIDGIYNLIQNNFYGFLDLRYFHMSGGIPFSILHDMQLVHDFDLSNWTPTEQGIRPLNDIGEQEYKKMVERYKRRICRFYSIFELEIPIYLFRWEPWPKDYVSLIEGYYKLYNLLTRKFPNCPIYLICVQSDGIGVDQDWGHPYIKHFSISSDINATWPVKGTKDLEWNRVFIKLGLVSGD